jgi:hypothetical protein
MAAAIGRFGKHLAVEAGKKIAGNAFVRTLKTGNPISPSLYTPLKTEQLKTIQPVTTPFGYTSKSGEYVPYSTPKPVYFEGRKRKSQRTRKTKKQRKSLKNKRK